MNDDPIIASVAPKTNFLTVFSRLYRLSVLCYGVPTSRRPIHRHLRMLMRSLINAPLSFRWQAFLDQNQVAKAFLQSNPRLIEKTNRAYLRNYFGSQKRFEALQSHYLILQNRFPMHIWKALARDQKKRITLAGIEGRSGEAFTIDLLQTPFSKEGELSLQLFDVGLNMAITTMTFALCESVENPMINIGGLQGIWGKASPEPIRRATRALQGLRPKNAVLFALFELSTWLGAESITAVSIENHIYSKKGCKPEKIKADYNAFWIEQNAARLPQGDFLIPTARRIRAMEEVPSNKRSEYRRRNALIAQLQQQVHDSLMNAARLPAIEKSESLMLDTSPVAG